jgi:hypothetical protein
MSKLVVVLVRPDPSPKEGVTLDEMPDGAGSDRPLELTIALI